MTKTLLLSGTSNINSLYLFTMAFSSIEEYMAALSLAVNTQDKKTIAELSHGNGIDWSLLPDKALDQIDDLFESVSYLFEE